MKKTLISLTLASFLLAGCVTPGEEKMADVYDASQVNQEIQPVLVNIVDVSPAKVRVSNSENKNTAIKTGALLGALAGGIIGHNSDNTAVGAVGGAAAGGVAGSFVKDKVIVDGVLITYSVKGKLRSSSQVGKRCMFQKGQALLVVTRQGETRVQPNAECPVQK